MSRLEDIREKLYRQKFEEPAPSPRDSLSSGAKEKEVRREWSSTVLESPTLLERTYLSKFRQRRTTGRFILVIAALVFLGLAAFLGYTLFFASGDVALSLLGPTQVTAGEPTVLIVQVVNGSSVALREGVVDLTFPEGALATEVVSEPSLGPSRGRLLVGDVPAGGKFEKEIRVRFFGVVGQTQTVAGTYLYRPENVESRIIRQAEFGVTVVRVPIVISTEVPERVGSGQELSVTVAVDSEASTPFPDMSLGIDFPAGFELTSVDPPPSTQTPPVWFLGSLESGTSRKITLRGKVKGEPEEVKAFRIRLGRYNPSAQTWLLVTETVAAPMIASPFLLVRTTLNGNREGTLAPGVRVNGNVFFRNNLPQKIENLYIAVTVPERLVELQSVRLERGFYDVSRRALVWNSASEPRLQELAPGEEGTLAFSFDVKSTLPIRSFSDKNFFFPVRSAMDSASPPPEYRGVALEYQETITFKLESSLRLAARSTYYDSPNPNTGPLPPQVRRTTTYTVYLQLASGANDLRDVEVKAQLPGGVEWREALRTDSGELAFNPANQELTWRVAKLAAATGILRPHPTAIFQVALTPAENQVNTSPLLVRGITAAGTDGFTATLHTANTEDLTIALRADAKSSSEEWRVVP